MARFAPNCTGVQPDHPKRCFGWMFRCSYDLSFNTDTHNNNDNSPGHGPIGVLDLVQHGNGKRIARSCSSVLSRSRLISFLLVLLACVPPTILLLLLVVAHVSALLLLLLLRT